MDTPPDSTIESAAVEPQAVLGYAVSSAPTNIVIWCRLLAIGMLGYGVERIATIAIFLIGELMGSPGPGRFDLVSFVGTCAVCLIWPLMAWYCWARAPQLALRISNGAAADSIGPSSTSHGGNEILCVALLTLGAYQLSEAMPTLATVFILSFRRIHDLSDLPWRDMTVPLVRSGLGALLIFGNHKVLAYLRKMSQPSEPAIP